MPGADVSGFSLVGLRVFPLNKWHIILTAEIDFAFLTCDSQHKIFVLRKEDRIFVSILPAGIC